MRSRLLRASLAALGLLVAANAAAATTQAPSPASLLAQPHLFFTTDDAKAGVLGVAPFGATATSRVLTSIACNRVDFAGGKGICLKTTASRAAPYMGFLFDGQLHFIRRFRITGQPLGVRVRPDGLVAAYTIGAYADRDEVTGPPTQTRVFFLDLVNTATISLDAFTVIGLAKAPVGTRFFADVSFDPVHLNRFYATLLDGRTQYLVRGDWTRHTVSVVRKNVSLPSVSPDGTRIAYIGTDVHRRLSVLELRSGKSHPVAERTRIGDQPTWLDAEHLLYVVASKAGDDLRIARADGKASPHLYMHGGASPSVVISSAAP